MSGAATAPPTPRRLRWRWILSVLLVLSSAPWWLPNLPWVRQWVGRRIALKSGLTCEIGRLWLVTRDGRPRAENIKLSSPGNTAGQTAITLTSVRAKLDWRALWRGRIVLDELMLDGADVAWQTQTNPPQAPEAAAEPDPDPPLAPPATTLAANQPEPSAPVGLVPLAGPDEAPTPATGMTETPPTLSETPATAPATAPAAAMAQTAPPQTAPPRTAPAPSAPAPPPRRWSLGQLTVRNLHVRLLAPGPQPRELASARLELRLPLAASGTGHLVARSVVLLGDRRWPHPVDLPLTSDGRTLSAIAVPLDCPGGRLSVSLRCETSAPGLPMVAEIKSETLSLPSLLAWVAPALAPAQGTVDGRLQLAGLMRYPRSFRSVGRVQARRLVLPLQAWLRDAELEAWGARVPQPEMLADPGRLVFRSLGSQVVVDDASLTSPEATLRGLGTVSAGAGLNFSGRAYLSAGGVDLANQLTAGWPPERRLELTALPNSPWAYLDSWVQGPLGEPAVVLWGRPWTLPQLREEVGRLNAPRAPPSG